jgi:hypothetical protein
MRRVMPLEPGMPSKPNITSTETVSEKPEGMSQEEWDGLSQEEKNKINEC